MDIRVNDILVMKKSHPCGEKRWLVLRTGAFSASCPKLAVLPPRLTISFDPDAFELAGYESGQSVLFSPLQLPDDGHPYITGNATVLDAAGIGPDTVLVTLRFRVLDTAAAGPFTFRIRGDVSSGVGAAGQVIALSMRDVAVTVRHVLSADNTLHSLEVPGFTLRPGFSPTVSTFTVNVPAYVSDVHVQYTAHPQADVSVSGNPHSLAEGENRLVIAVTAEDGSRREYVLIIQRAFQKPTESTGTGSSHTGSSGSGPTTTQPAGTSSAGSTPASGSGTSFSPGTASAPDASRTAAADGPAWETTATVTAATGPQPVQRTAGALYWLLIPMIIALLIAAYILVLHFTDKRENAKPDDKQTPPSPPS